MGDKEKVTVRRNRCSYVFVVPSLSLTKGNVTVPVTGLGFVGLSGLTCWAVCGACRWHMGSGSLGH